MSLAPIRPAAALPRWRLRRVLGIAVIASSLLASGPTPAQTPDGVLPLSLSDPSTGQSVTVEPGGTLLHLVFFATWCPPCRDELPRLAEIEARWRDGGYRLVIVAVPARQTSERLMEFATSRQVPGRLLFDSSGSAQRAFEARQIPTHILLDREGGELMRAPALEAEVEERIETLLIEYARGE